jgi:flagellum-specific peptidoglycan hydrolase FlgJ
MSEQSKIMEAYLEMVSEKKEVACEKCGEVHEGSCMKEKKELDPVNDKENDKPFAKRKDKDIDNDGDVDSSDEYLHKKRAATDDAIDDEEKKKKKNSAVKQNPKTSDDKAEISKIGEAFEELWSQIEEAVNQKKDATAPEAIDSKASGKEKEFVAKHPIDAKDHDELERIEEPKERKVKKEMREFEVIRALLSGNPQGEQ